MIVAVKAERDVQGYWTHPALVIGGCQTTVHLMHWLRWKQPECFVMAMRDDATEAFCAGWRDGPPDASAWELTPPPGEGGAWARCIRAKTGRSATGSARLRRNEKSVQSSGVQAEQR